MSGEITTRNVRLTDAASGAEATYAGFARSVAVVIGIDACGGGIPRLVTPANDARRVADVLRDEQGYEVPDPLTEDVTRERLVTLFAETLPGLNLGPADRLLVYFAGHGTALPGDDGEPEHYLLPQDAQAADRNTLLAMRRVRDELLKLQCRHLLVVLDCCFAGGFGRMRSVEEPPPGSTASATTSTSARPRGR